MSAATRRLILAALMVLALAGCNAKKVACPVNPLHISYPACAVFA